MADNIIYKGVRIREIVRTAPNVILVNYSENGVAKSERIKHICAHSPDGFEWGYGGSGPADTALSILHDYFRRTNRDLSIIDSIYYHFKNDIIARQNDELRIYGTEIEEWLKERNIEGI